MNSYCGAPQIPWGNKRCVVLVTMQGCLLWCAPFTMEGCLLWSASYYMGMLVMVSLLLNVDACYGVLVTMWMFVMVSLLLYGNACYGVLVTV